MAEQRLSRAGGNLLPEGWVKASIGEICSKVTDGSHNPPKASTEGLPMLSAKNIHDGKIDFSLDHRLIPLEDFKAEDQRTCIAKNDILLTIVGALGRTAVVTANTPKFSLQRSVAVLAAPQINSKSMRYSLEEFNFQQQVLDNAKGTAQKGIYLKKLRELTLPIPPFAEQKVIADKLDTLLGQVEDIKARLERIPEILKNFRQSVLAAAVSGKLTEQWRKDKSLTTAKDLLAELSALRVKILQEEIQNGNKETKRLATKLKKHKPNYPDISLPESWEWTSFMSSMERVVDCHNKTAPYIDRGIALIRTPDIRDGKINLECAKYISQETYDFWSRRCPPKSGDIIFTREAPMGEAGIVPEDTTLCMGQRMMLLRPISEFINPKYILLNILSLNFQQRMQEAAIGTGVKHLRVSDVEALTYPLAPFDEQIEIVSRVEELFTFADSIEQKTNSALERVNKLTQSVLAKAFRGELTAKWREANPELISGENSAEALLEKIKAERAAMKPAKKKSARKKA